MYGVVMDEVGLGFEDTVMRGGGEEVVFGTNDSVVTVEFNSERDRNRFLAA